MLTGLTQPGFGSVVIVASLLRGTYIFARNRPAGYRVRSQGRKIGRKNKSIICHKNVK